jgi:hypothetical protein
MHQGVIKKNGIVDKSQVIKDASVLQTKAADDGLHLNNFEVGNFEWWYFDIIDPETNCVLKIVIHLGTDPLRRLFFPQIAVSVKTPADKLAVSKIFNLNEFTAAHDRCNIKIAEKFRCYVEKNDYFIWVDMPEFSGEFSFESSLLGWKPLGNEITLERNKRSAAFGWIIPVPKATVNGNFIFKGKKYYLKNANGYHDHNFWKVEPTKKLFIDTVISKWYWGRFQAGDYTIIFMNTQFRNNQISSLYFSDGNKLLHSSNNFLQFFIKSQKMNRELKCLYPDKSIIKLSEEPETLNLVLRTKEVIDRRDLLTGVNPILRLLIKTLVSKPAYIGLMAECNLTHGNQNISGMGIFETMIFRRGNVGADLCVCPVGAFN